MISELNVELVELKKVVAALNLRLTNLEKIVEELRPKQEPLVRAARRGAGFYKDLNEEER